MPPTTAKRRPLDERALKDRAHALVRSGRFAAALDAYAALIAHHADDPALRLHQAELLGKLDRFPQAVAAYRTGARLLHAQGHTARARAALKNALAISPLDRELLAELRRLEAPAPAYPAPRLHLVKPPPPVPDEEILDSGDPIDERAEAALESIIVGDELLGDARPQRPEELTQLLPPVEPPTPDARSEATPAPRAHAARRGRGEVQPQPPAERGRATPNRREAPAAPRQRAGRDRAGAAPSTPQRQRLDAERAALLAADLADADVATDSYIPIFDFFDAERAALEARARDGVTASQRPRREAAAEARRSSGRTSPGRQTPRR